MFRLVDLKVGDLVELKSDKLFEDSIGMMISTAECRLRDGNIVKIKNLKIRNINHLKERFENDFK